MKKFLYRMVLMILEQLLPAIVEQVIIEIRKKNLQEADKLASNICSNVVNKVMSNEYTELIAREQVLSSSDKAVQNFKGKLS